MHRGEVGRGKKSIPHEYKVQILYLTFPTEHPDKHSIYIFLEGGGRECYLLAHPKGYAFASPVNLIGNLECELLHRHLQVINYKL